MPAFSMEERFNPYMPPEGELGISVAREDATRSETIRRAHLRHEGAVRWIAAIFGLPAFLSAVFVVAILVEIVRRKPTPADTASGLGFFATVIGLGATIGLGLRRLRPWARWISVVLTALVTLGSLLGEVVYGIRRGIPGAAIIYGYFLLIGGYVLYILLSPKGSVVFSPMYRSIRDQTTHMKPEMSWVLKVALALVTTSVLLLILPNIFPFGP